MEENHEHVSFNFHVHKSTIPDEEVKFLRSITNKLLKKSEKLDHSDQLAGEILNGSQISIPLNLFPASVEKLIKEEANKYVLDLSEKRHAVKEARPIQYWTVSQKENDFNPIHIHSGTISGIIYINIPNQVTKKDSVKGKTSFLFGTYHPWTLNFQGIRTITPKEGDLYLFPSWLNHSVYPFDGDEERRSIAFNFELDIVDNDKD